MTKDLTSGSPMRLILGFTLPTLFGLLFQQFYNLVDAMIVGKLLGAQALGAVGSTGSINFFVIGFCLGVCSGFAIPVAQRMGAKDYPQMRRYVANAAYLSAGIALVLTAATGLFCRHILAAMRTPADLFEDANAYIFVIFMGIPVVFLYNLLASVIRALGDSRTPVYFLALSAGLNIVLDLTFILLFDWGVAGAAIATVVSQGVSGAACLVYMVRKFPILRVTREERQPSLDACKALCAMGLPMGLQYSITAIGSIVLQTSVNALGSVYVSAVATGSKLYQLLACPFDAMGAAMATYCGQNVGAERLDRLPRGVRSCSLLGLGYAVAAFVAMLLFAPRCAMLFLGAGEPQLELLLALTTRYVVTLTAFFFPLALVNILRFSIQGMGFGTLAILAGVLEMIARTVVGHFFVPAVGYGAACFASPAAWICADLFLIPACLGCVTHLRRSSPTAALETLSKDAAGRHGFKKSFGT
ncbi:MAG: MATE family efflux transporter [Clostridiales bacterium]|nr:MATE family efflux transporter [Clostridiales bacterium]